MPEQIPLDQFADTVIDRMRSRHGRFEAARMGEGAAHGGRGYSLPYTWVNS